MLKVNLRPPTQQWTHRSGLDGWYTMQRTGTILDLCTYLAGSYNLGLAVALAIPPQPAEQGGEGTMYPHRVLQLPFWWALLSAPGGSPPESAKMLLGTAPSLYCGLLL